MQPYRQKNSGFFLMETIIGIMVLSVIVAATISLLNNKVSATKFVENKFSGIALASRLAFEYRIFKKSGSISGEVDGVKYSQKIDDTINGNLVLETKVMTPDGSVRLETYGH